MTSQHLYMKPHPICRATATNQCHHCHSIDHITHTLYGITLAICVASFALYKTTSSLYDIKPPFLWHHTHYIWNHIYCICVITPTVLVISHQLNFWDLIRYIWWHHIHCIWHHSHWICVITPTFSTELHPLYVGHHTHYMNNIIYTV